MDTFKSNEVNSQQLFVLLSLSALARARLTTRSSTASVAKILTSTCAIAAVRGLESSGTLCETLHTLYQELAVGACVQDILGMG